MKGYISVIAAAQRAKVSRVAIYAAVKAGRLVAKSDEKGVTVVAEKAVDKYAATARRRTPSAE